MSNKVAIVTGASKGIGAATVIAFGKAGYDVVVNYHQEDASAKKVAHQIEKVGQKALLVKADVFSEDGIEELFSKVKTEFDKIDVFVNNAALVGEPAYGEYTLKNISKRITDVFGSYALCTQEAAKLMDKGSILFASSIYGLPFGGNPKHALYSASKAAVINFAQTMAEQLSPNIRCNVVAPGTTKTPSWDGAAPEYVNKSLGMTLQGEWVDATEIANAFVFLAETSHMNAQTIVVDAGWQKKIRDSNLKIT